MKKEQIRQKIIGDLSEKIINGDYDFAHARRGGIISRQIVALIDLLIEQDLIKVETVTVNETAN